MLGALRGGWVTKVLRLTPTLDWVLPCILGRRVVTMMGEGELGFWIIWVLVLGPLEITEFCWGKLKLGVLPLLGCWGF